MKSVYTLTAPAKINLYLEILGDRPDGFHELVMILQTVALADRIHLATNQSHEIRLFCHHPQVPLNETNLSYRGAALLKKLYPQRFHQFGGVDITIEKNIPVAAGLAGGSTDGAAVLVGLNVLWELGLTQPELQDLAAQLGSDVPFCIGGGTAIATGRGEKLDAIPDLDGIPVILAKYGNIGVSTPWAYQTYRQQFGHGYLREDHQWRDRTQQIHAGNLVKAIQQRDISAIAASMHNDLEKVVLPEYPQVQRLREAFITAGAIGSMMSGSGPTVFALCDSLEQAESVKTKVAEQFADPELSFWITTICSTGIQLQQSNKIS